MNENMTSARLLNPMFSEEDKKEDSGDEDGDEIVVAMDNSSSIDGMAASIKSNRRSSPEESASLWSQTFFNWVGVLMAASTAKRKVGDELEPDDIWQAHKRDEITKLVPEFRETMKKAQAKMVTRKNPSGSSTWSPDPKFGGAVLRQALWDFNFEVLLELFWWSIAIIVTNSVMPIFIFNLLTFITTPPEERVPEYVGYLFAFGLALSRLFAALADQQWQRLNLRIVMRTKHVLVPALLEKTLSLNAADLQTHSSGKIINFLQQDLGKPLPFGLSGYSALFENTMLLSVNVVVIYYLIGVYALAGCGAMMAATPISSVMVKHMSASYKRYSEIKDKRISQTNEFLQHIEGVKMGTWEHFFEITIGKLRKKELGELRFGQVISIVFAGITAAAPIIGAVVAIVLYVSLGGAVDVAIVFTIVSAFRQLETPLLKFPQAIELVIKYKVSSNRLGPFLTATPSVDSQASQSPVESSNNAIEFENANLYWGLTAADEKKSNNNNNNDDSNDNNSNNDKKEKNSHKNKNSRASNANANGNPDDTIIAVPIGSTDEEQPQPQQQQQQNIPAMLGATVNMQKGKITAIVGPVGSGKSALCASILGDMLVSGGRVSTEGEMAYVPQTPWMVNATIRENILFGEEYEAVRYRRVIQVCQLRHDLDVLRSGDKTMIGEKGINLSGGQKARISTARAAYSRRDIMVLDDPLSALDPAVANMLFHQCICDFMRGRTVVLVTNQLNFLQSCDSVIVLELNDDDENNNSNNNTKFEEAECRSTTAAGRVATQDTYANLVTSSKVDFAEMLSRFNASTHQSKTNKTKHDPEEERKEVHGGADDYTNQDAEVLMQIEERNRGAINFSLYAKLFQYAGGRWLMFAMFVLYSIAEGAKAFNTAFLGFWSEAASSNYSSVVPFDELEQNLGIDFALPEDPGAVQSWYIMWYAISGMLIIISEIAPSIAMLAVGLRAAHKVYMALFDSVKRAPLSFFQTTPIGRILSRFANDTGDIDAQISDKLIETTILVASVVAALVVITVILPPFLVGLFVVSLVYMKIMKIYRPVNRDLKRITALSTSPVFAHFSETLNGLTTIRAYGAQGRFNAINVKNVKVMMEDTVTGKHIMLWLGCRLGLINFIVTLISAVLIVYSALAGQLSPANAGVAITYTMLFTSKLSIAVIFISFLEEAMVSFEQVTHYIENVEHEAPATSNNPPPSSWPATGLIVIQDLKMRYRKDTPLVLHGLSLTIQAGERVGVVGRTGSGKSSLMLCLLRLVEPEYEQSSPAPIVIDGVDICKIGLHELRSKISIVPQNPVVFSGTLRSNLDPQSEHSDAALWAALERCNLKTFVSSSMGKLSWEVSDAGSNLSQGQRQLLTLARSLLSKTKILLLDEATSSVDFDTDATIQKTIRGEDAFGGCTVITIAHRINTVIDSDMMLVLNQGLVAEFDSPKALLANPSSMLSSMVAQHRQE